MPYLFGLLVVINAVVFAFYLFVHEPKDSATVQAARVALPEQVSFENTSSNSAPEIGTKK